MSALFDCFHILLWGGELVGGGEGSEDLRILFDRNLLSWLARLYLMF